MTPGLLQRIGVLQARLIAASAVLGFVLLVVLVFAYSTMSGRLIARDAVRLDALAAEFQASLGDVVMREPGRLAADVSMFRRVGGLAYLEVRDAAGRVLVADGGPAMLGVPDADLRTALDSGQGHYDFQVDLLQPGYSASAGTLRARADLTELASSLNTMRNGMLVLAALILILQGLLTRWVLGGVLDGVAAIEERALALRRAEVL
ncbi:MAG TPA: PAS domain S-box protein, partial [Methyloversatilis sp.]